MQDETNSPIGSWSWAVGAGTMAAFGLALITGLAGRVDLATQVLVVALGLLAICFQSSPHWSVLSYSLWVLAFVAQAMVRPEWFSNWPYLASDRYIVLLIQVIMFGMGTTLSLADFGRVLLMPKAIAMGMMLQFTVMPVTGWVLANTFGFPPEIAAGVILIGACPGGVASNVITYLARADVALSVTMTACSTLVSPIMTPLAMSLLAGSTVDVSFAKMMWSILEITIAPVVLGLVVSYLLQYMKWNGPWLDRWLSRMAMLSICIVIGIIVAQNRAELLVVGLAVATTAILHNSIGYLLGYLGARAIGLDERVSRTISIEVGMQNGGMAVALATKVMELPPAAIAGAIFGAWMNVSGSLLASWWRSKDAPPKTDTDSSAP
jgi:BASS family bile acid:Na+ symporter